MLFENLLKQKLEKNISEKVSGKIHKSSLDGLVKILVRVLSYAEANKHFDENGNNDGNHIMYSEFKLLKRNKLAQKFIYENVDGYGNSKGESLPFFLRSPNSTYHANNARFGSNGYSHWYLYSNIISKSLSEAYAHFSKAFGIYTKFSESVNKFEDSINKVTLVPDDLDISKYLVIPKERFSFIVNKFIEGIYEGGSLLINRAMYADENFVYVLNEVNSSNRLGGKCRQYTTIGSLRKDVRNYILSGYKEIDLGASVQTLFLNAYYNNKLNLETVKLEFPKHYELITQKKLFRSKLASIFKVNEDDAKAIITSITYSPNSRIIFKFCNKRGFSVKRTKQCKEFINPFIEETKIIREKILIKFYNENDKVKSMIDKDIALANEKLSGKGKGKSLDDRRVFRIYEMFEYVVRTAMVNYVSLNNEVVYQIHDCVIFKNDVDCRKMLEYINDKTKFNVGCSLSIMR